LGSVASGWLDRSVMAAGLPVAKVPASKAQATSRRMRLALDPRGGRREGDGCCFMGLGFLC
jgi:hypothetical protein